MLEDTFLSTFADVNGYFAEQIKIREISHRSFKRGWEATQEGSGQLQRADAIRPFAYVSVRADSGHGPTRRHICVSVRYCVHAYLFLA